MTRNRKTPAVIALCCAVAGVGLVGCDDEPSPATDAAGSSASAEQALQGSKKIKVDGRSVHVSCSGRAAEGQPVVMLMHGGGDDVKKMAGFQKKLSKKNRVCSYDRLGAGTSDKPKKAQSIDDSGKVLNGVLDKVAGDNPVVLAGHSLGGLIAARFAPDHQDKVAGLVLMDATPPTQNADVKRDVPESADGPAAEVRDQFVAISSGQNPEKLVIRDGKVRSAGDIPVEVLKHGKQYLAEIPQYGKAMERSWSEGQKKWLKISSNSSLATASKSEHYIYVDEPGLAAKAVERVAAQAART
ncbi:alpha/beta fold hydrolase [Streptomyces sulphureus]|uniref:alpha/beta fold hydrolase n=1 Tax=Streptomyces sulphureus TaxID=47758 RepID=UPI00037F2977|nr:alpha/beta hydrolase [Streptomyces sulphureus]